MAKAPKQKKEKKEKKRKKEEREKRAPLPRVPLTPADAAVTAVATIFLAAALIFLALALDAAVSGDPSGIVHIPIVSGYQTMPKVIDSVWFAMPDGTFVNGDGQPFEAPPPYIYGQDAPKAPAVPETPPSAAEETLPEEEVEEPEPSEESTQAERPVGSLPGTQDWTVMVWISRRGGSYHSRSDCEAMDPGTPREVAVQEAVALDCLRCQRCW